MLKNIFLINGMFNDKSINELANDLTQYISFITYFLSLSN